MHDEPRTDLERRALAAFTAAEPPPDFADRVLAAQAAQERPSAGPGPRGRLLALAAPRLAGLVVAALAVAAAALAATRLLSSRTGPSDPDLLDIELSGPRAEVPIGAGAPPPSLPPKPAIRPDLADAIDGYLGGFGRRYGDAFKFHGVVTVVKDGEVVFSRGYGLADRERALENGATTRFKIGSLTQTFTAVAVLQLRDRGLIDLDAPVRKYIPDYPAVGSRVTVRHLLTHTSGIPSYTDAIAFAVGHTRPVSAADVRAIFQDLPLEFQPGTDFDLNNSGYFLLGQVVENVSRRRFADYLAENVLAPAGMRDSGIGLAVDTVGYEFDEDEVLVPAAQRHPSAYWAAAGMVSTAADLARWDRALRTPGLVLAQASLDEMTTIHKDDYGLGWFIRREPGRTIAWHPGGVEGYNATIARFLDDGVTVFALANTEAVDTRAVVYDVAQLAHGAALAPPREHEELRLAAAQYARFTGRYVLSETSRAELKRAVDPAALEAIERVRVYRKGERLFLEVPEHADKWMHFAGDDQFFFKDPAGTTAEFGPPGAPVAWLVLRAQGAADTAALEQSELRFVFRREGN